VPPPRGRGQARHAPGRGRPKQGPPGALARRALAWKRQPPLSAGCLPPAHGSRASPGRLSPARPRAPARARRRHPVYPPQEVQAWLGASPSRLAPASPWFRVLASDALQTFPLYADAPPARRARRAPRAGATVAPWGPVSGAAKRSGAARCRGYLPRQGAAAAGPAAGPAAAACRRPAPAACPGPRSPPGLACPPRAARRPCPCPLPMPMP
jgi:hypothetical protein